MVRQAGKTVGFKNKVAVVTGGARGIGKQIALSFAAGGARTVIADINDTTGVFHEPSVSSDKIMFIHTDVTSRNSIQDMFNSAVRNFGSVDILVNNAAVTFGGKPLLEVSEENWDSTINVNLKGYFFCTQAAAALMMQKKYGKIINIDSVSGLSTYMRNQTHNYTYAISKAGIVMLTKLAARELGKYGINVNAIAPGLVHTEILDIGRTPDQVQKFIDDTARQVPLGKIGTTEDIAKLALFLASEDSSYITGQIISADGGWVV